MKKIIIFFMLFLIGITLVSSETSYNSQVDADSETNLPNCGDGICQDVSCLGLNCTESENSKNCPSDCGDDSEKESESDTSQEEQEDDTEQKPEKTYKTQEGKTIQIRYNENKKVRIKSDEIESKSEIELEIEVSSGTSQENQTKIKAKLSNGKNVEIKVMPDSASEKALEKLRLRNCNESNNCSIVLKEISKENQTKAAYEIKVQKKVKLFGFINTKMQVQAQVNAENGEVLRVNKPWWAFLASEPEE